MRNVQGYPDFEKTANALQAVTGMTMEQRKQVQALATGLNEYFTFAAGQIMSAAFELGRAGFKYEQIMGALRETLNLALAGDIDLQQSADIATNVLTAMRLPMETTAQAARSLTEVNDALSYAASNSNTDVRLMGETFKYVGPMAAAAGMGVQEVAAAAMVMAKNGIRGAEAGVAMRSALVRMVKPTKGMNAALERLGVNRADFVKEGRQITAQDVISSLAADGIDASAYAEQIAAALRDPSLKGAALTERLTDIIAGDGSVVDKSALAEAITDTLTAAGSEVDFFGFIEALKAKGADLGDIARIFDARQGSRLITLLAGDLLGELEGVRKGAPGATDKMARIRMQGVVGDVAALVSAFQNLFVTIANAGVLKAATDVIKAITSGLKALAETSPQLLKWGTYAVMLAGVIAPLGMLMGGVLGFFGTLGSLLRLISRFSGGAVRVLRAAAGFGAAAAGTGIGGAAAGAAAGAGTAAAAKGGLWRTLFRGAGAVGAGLIVKDLLDWIDPKGNLWGLTSGIDAWFEKHLGFNPSQVGGVAHTADKASMASELDALLARQAELDARLAQIAANTHPAMRDAPNPERDNLLFERSTLEAQIAEAEAAGAAVMQAFRQGMQSEAGKTEASTQELVQKLIALLSFTVAPIISPRVSGAALRAVHADVGID